MRVALVLAAMRRTSGPMRLLTTRISEDSGFQSSSQLSTQTLPKDVDVPTEVHWRPLEYASPRAMRAVTSARSEVWSCRSWEM
jgi:hypothetical protein